MNTFPGVPWDAWEDMPYDVVMACVSFTDERFDGQSED